MNKLEFAVYKLKSGDITSDEFEGWVYSEPEIEKILTPDEYLHLISLNYKNQSSLHEAEIILSSHINIGDYYKWLVKGILQKIIERPPNAHRFIEQCYDLYCDGFGFLDNIGLGYGLSITAPPSDFNVDSWDQLDSSQKKELIDSFYPEVANEATKVIAWLDAERIIITGHNGDYQGIEYEDRRSDAEIAPTSYQIHSPLRDQ